MEPITLVFGGSSLGLLLLMGKVTYNYGRDRKELNGTVERVKRIEVSFQKHIDDEAEADREIRESLTRLETKVDLLVNHKIKE